MDIFQHIIANKQYDATYLKYFISKVFEERFKGLFSIREIYTNEIFVYQDIHTQHTLYKLKDVQLTIVERDSYSIENILGKTIMGMFIDYVDSISAQYHISFFKNFDKNIYYSSYRKNIRFPLKHKMQKDILNFLALIRYGAALSTNTNPFNKDIKMLINPCMIPHVKELSRYININTNFIDFIDSHNDDMFQIARIDNIDIIVSKSINDYTIYFCKSNNMNGTTLAINMKDSKIYESELIESRYLQPINKLFINIPMLFLEDMHPSNHIKIILH